MLYNAEYIKKAHAEFTAIFKSDENGKLILDPDFEAQQYTVDVEGSFKTPPMLQMAIFMGDTSNREQQDLMTRHAILGKKVTVLLDGQSIFSFQMNNLTDHWEAFVGFEEHPMAYQVIVDMVVASIVKKWSARRKKTPETNAPTANRH